MRLFNGSEQVSGPAPSYSGGSFQFGIIFTALGTGGPYIGGTLYDDGCISVRLQTDRRIAVTIYRTNSSTQWLSTNALGSPSIPTKIILIQWEAAALTVWGAAGTSDSTIENGAISQVGSGSLAEPNTSAIIGRKSDTSDGWWGKIGQVWVAPVPASQTGVERNNWFNNGNLPGVEPLMYVPMYRPIGENEQDVARTDPNSTDPADRLIFTATHQFTVNSNPVTRFYAAGATGTGNTEGDPSGNLLTLLTASAGGDIIQVDGAAGAMPEDTGTWNGTSNGTFWSRRQHVIVQAKVGTSIQIGSMTWNHPWVWLKGTSTYPIQVTGRMIIEGSADHWRMDHVTTGITGTLTVMRNKHGRAYDCNIARGKIVYDDESTTADGMYIGCGWDADPTIDWVMERGIIGPLEIEPPSTAHVDAIQTGCGRHLVFRHLRIGYSGSQVLMFGNEGGPLDGVLFDHCEILGTGEVNPADIGGIVNLANANSSGGNGVHTNISMIHCTIGIGDAQALPGSLDFTTKGSAGSYSNNFRMENCLVNRYSVGSSLVRNNLAESDVAPGLKPDNSLLGPGNLVGTIQTIDPSTRPNPNLSIAPYSPGAGYRSTTIDTKVRDSSGYAYATVSNTDIAGIVHDVNFHGWGARAQTQWDVSGGAHDVFVFDGILPVPHELWQRNQNDQPWTRLKVPAQEA